MRDEQMRDVLHLHEHVITTFIRSKYPSEKAVC